ncbi:acetylxylan esterase [Colletotrichum spaethianum]|uniref:Acetylxylan esterase n=1 Tax=Colletotrichum spaethianum TaxID=700344 RepID=A0AA37L8K5_9PEZI|nr:acetylxylan esterase [Colletotrichum spaethianum]GKT42669.1 acetylxylan esterase [Colletotrichum spaethianum]
MSISTSFAADSAWPLWDSQPVDGAFEIDLPEGTIDQGVVTKVSRPWLFGYKPTTPSNGRAVLILGGGGYVQLMVGREGIAVARWLADLGFEAYVLIHRFPTAETGPLAPVDDARQALRLMEEKKAGLRGLAVCGLSSGGHLASALLAEYPASWATTAGPPVPKPEFAIIGYGPISTNAKGHTIVPNKSPLDPPAKQELYDIVIPDQQVARPAPPTFIVYSANDPIVPVVNAYRLAQGLQAAEGSVELHVFADAPHGFGLDTKNLPVSKWPSLATAWLQQKGYLKDE